MSKTDYSPEQITQALMAMVACGGDARLAAEELIDDEFQVPVATLRRWKSETHADRYMRLEEKYGAELEEITIGKLRKNADRAAEVEAGLLEEMTAEKVAPEMRPQALRAVADVKAKSVDKLLALTGRPSDGKTSTDTAALIRSLASKGLVKLNVNLDVVEGTAEEAPAQLRPAPD